MPSPFPGMDPYLENPVRWQGVHQSLITYATEILNATLPPRYVASITERLYVVQQERGIYPDEMREVSIEIVPTEDEGRVVTAIEVLSPSNKAAGSEGRELYLAKQREILESQTHLIEIDLLRRGEHTVAPPRESLRRRGHWDYVVSLHHGGEGNRYELWTFTVRQRLPNIRVPLADGDPDVGLDLQAVFNRCYDACGYGRRVDYRRDPSVPLAEEDAQWADTLLRERGLRA